MSRLESTRDWAFAVIPCAGLMAVVLAPLLVREMGPAACFVYALSALIGIPLVVDLAGRSKHGARGSLHERTRRGGSRAVAVMAGVFTLVGYTAFASLLTRTLVAQLGPVIAPVMRLPGGAVLWGAGLSVVACIMVAARGCARQRWPLLLVAGLVALVVSEIVRLPGEAQTTLPSITAEKANDWLTPVAMLLGGYWAFDRLSDRSAQRGRGAHARWVVGSAWVFSAVLAFGFSWLLLANGSMHAVEDRLAFEDRTLEVLSVTVGSLFLWRGLEAAAEGVLRTVGRLRVDARFPASASMREAALGYIAFALAGGALLRLGSVAYSAELSAGAALLLVMCGAFVEVFAPAPERTHRPILAVVNAGIAFYFLVQLAAPVGISLFFSLLCAGVYCALVGRRRSRPPDPIVQPSSPDSSGARPIVVVLAGAEINLALLAWGARLARARGERATVLQLIDDDPLGESHSPSGAERQLARSIERAGHSAHLDARVVMGHTGSRAALDLEQLVLVADSAEHGRPSGIAKELFGSWAGLLVVVRGPAPEACERLLIASEEASLAEPLRDLADALFPRAQRIELASSDVSQEPTGVWRKAGELHREAEVALFGAAPDALFGQPRWGGPPFELAAERSGASLIVKGAESPLAFSARRCWELLSHAFTDLSSADSAALLARTRVVAQGGPEFYILMVGSSLIAITGLVLDSAAVIIGAMVVAPLMGPILAMAEAIPRGNGFLLRRAANTTLRGTLCAISVATIFSLVLPYHAPPAEVMARAAPNLLDLMVALCAGGLGAFASARKDISSALSGIAISVALVPPLCVVGYGLGTVRFEIAAQALLLFLTNLAGMTVVAAVVFLFVGLRPRRGVERALTRRTALWSALSVLLVAIPLGVATSESYLQAEGEAELRRALSDLEQRLPLRVVRTGVKREGPIWVSSPVIYVERRVPESELSRELSALSAGLDVRLTLRPTVVRVKAVYGDVTRGAPSATSGP